MNDEMLAVLETVHATDIELLLLMLMGYMDGVGGCTLAVMPVVFEFCCPLGVFSVSTCAKTLLTPLIPIAALNVPEPTFVHEVNDAQPLVE